MKINVTRRDLFRVAAGAAAGAMLTPAPWKMIDDLAIWTQNWKWIPRPPEGPLSAKKTRCTLCPAGCALEAKMIGASVVAMRSASCSLGLTAHHLPYHPARTKPAPLGKVTSEIADARRRGPAAVLDMRPGRSVSHAWRHWLGTGGTYIPSPAREGISMAALGAALDVESASTIVSFGAPVADGWGSGSAFRRLLNEEVHFIHVEPVHSRTSQLADHWLPAKPGTEADLALALGELVKGGQVNLTAVERTTGVRAHDIRTAAREMVEHGPTVVIAGEDPAGGRLGPRAEAAIMNLNILLGGASLAARKELPAPFASDALAPVSEIEQVADGTLALLIIDASDGVDTFPWSIVQRKLAKDALVVALSPFNAGVVRHAKYVVPTAPFLESPHELPPSFDTKKATLVVSAPVMKPREGDIDPATFIGAGTTEELIKARIAAIHASGEGAVDGKPVKEFSSPDEVWTALIEGGRWETDLQPLKAELIAVPTDNQQPTTDNLILLPRASRDVTASAAVSPVITKLYQESALRHSAGTAVVNPRTAQKLGVRAGSMAKLETRAGRATVKIATSAGVMPGVVELNVGPDATALGQGDGGPLMIDICPAGADGVWHSAAARLVEA